MTPTARAAFLARRAEIDRRYPDTERATFANSRDQLLHALRASGYSDQDIAKIWSGNVLRVMREVEGLAAALS